jgi:hypothetical protein
VNNLTETFEEKTFSAICELAREESILKKKLTRQSSEYEHGYLAGLQKALDIMMGK